MIIVYGIFIITGVFACFVWWKICTALYRHSKKLINYRTIKENSNPYILAQKRIDKNTQDYYEYLEWMQKNSSGVPIEKLMTKEEFVAEQKIKTAYNK